MTGNDNNTNEIVVTKKTKSLVFLIKMFSLIVILGVGYAYFSGALSNTNRETANLETATIALRFDDNDNGVSGTLNLGESVVKKFKLQNTGTKDAYAKIT